MILVGNPNVGKSVIFGYLTGKYLTASNYSCTTAELTSGVSKFGDEKYNVIDTPGTNNLIPMSEDEEVTRNILLKDSCKTIIHVCDSKNLGRGLLQGIQLAEMNVPIVSALNIPITSGTGIETGSVISREVMTCAYSIPPGVELKAFFRGLFNFSMIFLSGSMALLP